MNIAGLRSIGFAVLLVLLAGAGCNRSKRASSESSAARRHPMAFARASLGTRQMHSTIRRRTCRSSLAHYCGASRSKT